MRTSAESYVVATSACAGTPPCSHNAAEKLRSPSPTTSTSDIVNPSVRFFAALDGDYGAVFNVSLTLRVHDEQARYGLQPQTCWPLTMSLAMSLTISLERVKRTPQYLRIYGGAAECVNLSAF